MSQLILERQGGAESASRGLQQQMDDLSTRLMIGGAGKLTAADFESLSEAAAAEEHEELVQATARLAAEFAAARRSSVAVREKIATEGLEGLRAMLGPATPVLLPRSNATAAAPTPVAESQSGDSAFAADPEMVGEFITESREHLVAIEHTMLELEADSTSTEAINAVFRGFHTIKGLAGFFEFHGIQEVAHEVETLLDLARTARLAITPLVVDVVLESTDFLRQEIKRIDDLLNHRKAHPSQSNVALLARIRAVSQARAAIPGDAEQGDIEQDHAEKKRAGELVVPSKHHEDELRGEEPQGEPMRVDEPSAAVLAAARAARSLGEAAAPSAVREERRSSDTSSVRIETAKLDRLMNMVGEMVIAQTLIAHNAALAAVNDTRLRTDLTQLARITSEVQKVTTSIRMVPIGLQFQKTARMVRDLSRRAGKQIALVMSGEDTELDKTIAEEISDPLLHMVRNSIDHGIEMPEERLRTGKDAVARIRLAAYHQAGQIVIEIADDGRGLNREKILAKAMERGLVKAGAQLSDGEIFQLIFEAGFSTADKITDISGRGVGMDVVRRHVQQLRGRIEIQSRQGRGTTFFLKLPLTLAIIDGLVVEVAGNRYILPLSSVTEMFRPTQAGLSTLRGKGEMATVRGSLLPVVRLHERFRLEPRWRELTEGMLVVVESEDKRFCLFVDELLGKQEVVIKGLGETFREIAGLAGCAILGDGRVGLILDPEGIFHGKLAGVA